MIYRTLKHGWGVCSTGRSYGRRRKIREAVCQLEFGTNRYDWL
jgi:hypothetical protein